MALFTSWARTLRLHRIRPDPLWTTLRRSPRNRPVSSGWDAWWLPVRFVLVILRSSMEWRMLCIG